MKELEIFQEVMQCFWEKKEIKDDALFYILDTLSELFVESCDDSEWQCYDRILDQLNKVWQYKQFSEISAEQSYLYGAIWGGLSMLSSIKKKKAVSQQCHTLAEEYKFDTSYIFLDSVRKKPGIQNKKLAQVCNVSPSRISQIAAKALDDGLISVQVFGKEKSYYIRTKGESVYDILQKNYVELVKMPRVRSYKDNTFSNEVKTSPVNITFLDTGTQYVNEEIEFKERFNLLSEYIFSNIINFKNERTNITWKQEKNSAFRSLGISCEPLREAHMINQLSYMK